MSDIEKALEMVSDVAKLRGMYDQVCIERDALKAEVERLKEAQRFTYCAYCGWKTSVDDKAEELSRHVESCQKHPVFIWKSLAERAREALEHLCCGFTMPAEFQDIALKKAQAALKLFDDKEAKA